MCFLAQQKHFKLALPIPAGDSRQKISNLDAERAALKKKNDQRAFALLKALAKHQVTPPSSLHLYPRLQKALAEKQKENQDE